MPVQSFSRIGPIWRPWGCLRYSALWEEIMITPRTIVAAAVLATMLSGCGYRKGRIEGRISYIDSSWDPDGPPGRVPNLLVHVIPGTEADRRKILESYEPVVARGIPGRDVPGIVEHIKVWHTDTGQIVQAQEVSSDGSFAFDKLEQGQYLVFADYNTDLGYFGWLVPVEVQGTRTAVIEMDYDDRLPILMPPEKQKSTMPAPSASELPEVQPPPALEIEVPEDKVPEILEKLGETAPNP